MLHGKQRIEVMLVAFSGSDPATFTPPNDETPDLRGFRGDGRYWARTSDPQLVELIQRGHGRALNDTKQHGYAESARSAYPLIPRNNPWGVLKTCSRPSRQRGAQRINTTLGVQGLPKPRRG
jgi:hypothetical protein